VAIVTTGVTVVLICFKILVDFVSQSFIWNDGACVNSVATFRAGFSWVIVDIRSDTYTKIDTDSEYKKT